MTPGRSALLTGLACGGCRVSLLRCFGFDVAPAHSFRAARSIATTAHRASRASSDQSESLRLLQELSSAPLPHSSAPLIPPPSSNLTPHRPIATPDPGVPWYLQDQQSLRAPSTPSHLIERQKIPELPPNAPPMLPEFLEFVSKELGMDYLSLLDLRSLDPPAALGTNLIMILGTARSEKHLHVSAHRCCRWLRSTRKLRPHADGLLGRNEMKLKLKRKAKRSKLLASVGSTEQPDLDDGIRTGWVCVTVGNVEPTTEEEYQEDAFDIAFANEEEDLLDDAGQGEGFVGFGESSDRLTIVLQMFTEEKRAEVDLEALWSNLLGKSQRRSNNKGLLGSRSGSSSWRGQGGDHSPRTHDRLAGVAERLNADV